MLHCLGRGQLLLFTLGLVFTIVCTKKILTLFASETHIFMTVIGTVMRPRTIHDSEAFGSCSNYHVSVNQLCKHSKGNIDFPEKDKFL